MQEKLDMFHALFTTLDSLSEKNTKPSKRSILTGRMAHIFFKGINLEMRRKINFFEKDPLV